MRSLSRAALVLAVLTVGGLPAVPAAQAAADAAMIEERVYVETTVDTDHDGRPDRVAVDIARPTGSAPVPVVFEHSPYRTGLNNVPNHNVNVDRLPQEDLFDGARLAGRDPGDMAANKPVPDLPGWYDDYFLPRGYAVVLGHSIGTGSSEGCPTGGDRSEALGATAVIDWLNGRARGYDSAGRQVTATWSTGNVGMIGISYDGTLPNMAAATGVPGLKAIVPIAAISSWYDYYRANGLVVAPGGYQGEDADVLARAVVKRAGCGDELDALEAAQDRVTGDLIPFWQERDYVRHADQVGAAVFVIHGQSDWNVKGRQYARWWEALKQRGVPRKIWLHNGGHGTASRSDYQATVGRWFDQYVKGVDTGIPNEPKSDVQYRDGTWRQFADWPDPAATRTVFHLGAGSATAPGELTTTPATGEVRQTFTDQGRTIRAETLAANPDTANANRLVYRTAPLPTAMRLSGVAQAELRVAVENRGDANLTALLVDYGPAGGTSSPVVVTRGWLDPQNRGGAETGEKVVQGEEYALRFDLQPKDHVFAAGRRIGLVVISTDYDYTLRPLGGTRLRVAPALSTLTLPLTDLGGGPGPACTGHQSTHRGTLNAGSSAYQPDGGHYQSTVAGTHRACLAGPEGADFDLYLQKWNGSSWANVASSTSSGANETVSHNGTAGYYRYRVHAYRGSGAYELGLTRP
ncbi:Xaa-Pro dipeptidyl-peptidase [Nonomuraea sp. NN258]|uniref:Xaa-Pro dipeptidyl-peptidase n=1 Tax=Nonomuraea antri TaxID=2730852 RepID=UPI00156963F5|nr:Xaa-Pro dipeptidyl-peptidase [Nonomuraea antri]NRQ33580.1 Xaa-Pro dipeptidyl-peptidase [Nonomuraea antri]